MQHLIIMISPYEDEYMKLKKCLVNSYVLYYFDSFKNAELFLEEHDNVELVLLSSKIEDLEYTAIIDNIVTRYTSIKVLVYASQASLDEISVAMKMGVYQFVVGDHSFTKIISIIDNVFSTVNSIEGSQEKLCKFGCEVEFRLNVLFDTIHYFEQFPTQDDIKALVSKFINWKQELMGKLAANVLVIEDESIYLKFLTDIISVNYNVVGCGLGNDSLELIKKDVYGVVLVDLFLPDIDGLELVKKLKSELPLSEIIIITAFDLPDTVSEVLKLGVSDYMNKPILKESLLKAVKKAETRFFQKYINKEALDTFFPKELSYDEKVLMLKCVHLFKEKKNKKLIVEDLYLLFPSLRSMNIPDSMAFPTMVNTENLKVFIRSLV